MDKNILLSSLVKIIEAHNPLAIIMFGSYKQNFTDEYSDLDIAIVFEDNSDIINKRNLILVEVQNQFGDMIVSNNGVNNKRFVDFAYISGEEVDFIYSTLSNISNKSDEYVVLMSRAPDLVEILTKKYLEFKSSKSGDLNEAFFITRSAIVALKRKQYLRAAFQIEQLRYFIVNYLASLQGLIGNSYRHADKINYETNFNLLIPKTIAKKDITKCLTHILDYLKTHNAFKKITGLDILEKLLIN